MITITGRTAPALFVESLYKMRVYGMEESSRNGTVRSILNPVVMRLMEPEHRVITDPVRDANPFFHVMEFIWMMSGSNDIQWIAQFNKNMMKFSDDGVTQHAAYGYRWHHHFGFDQIKEIIRLLEANPLDRRLVVNMWDPRADLGRSGSDFPCNTNLLFRVVDGELQMSVINRSNDLIWGALGANICHMTMLQELIARAAGLPIGEYFVFTQNLHIYEDVPNFDYYMKDPPHARNVYRQPEPVHTVPLLQGSETYDDFVNDCIDLVGTGKGKIGKIRTNWMRHVGSEMYKIWLQRKLREQFDTSDILADDWRIACEEWINRRSTSVGDQQRDHYTSHASREQESQGLGSSAFQPNPMAGVDNPVPDLGATPPELGANGYLPQKPL